MVEYIEREELLELYRMDDPVLNENGHVPLSVIRQNIMDIPSADVAPVRHGRWIGVDSSYWRWSHDGGHMVEHITFRCSECARKSIIKTNYCPNCGAKMDGGAD